MKITKVEKSFNSDLQWFKKKGFLSEHGIEFADLYQEYIDRKSSKPSLNSRTIQSAKDLMKNINHASDRFDKTYSKIKKGLH